MIGEVPAGENLFSFHWNIPPSHALLIQFKPINHHSQVKRAGLWRSSPNHPEGLVFFQRPKRWSHSVHSFFFPRQAHRSHTTSAILECSDPDLTHPGPWIYPANLNSLKTVINRGFEHIHYIKHRYGGRPCLKITADMIILLYLEGQLTHSAKDVHLCVCLVFKWVRRWGGTTYMWGNHTSLRKAVHFSPSDLAFSPIYSSRFLSGSTLVWFCLW